MPGSGGVFASRWRNQRAVMVKAASPPPCVGKLFAQDKAKAGGCESSDVLASINLWSGARR